MIDIKLVRESPELIEENLKKRGESDKIILLKKLIKDDKKRREIIKELQKLKHKKNIYTQKISELKQNKKPIGTIKKTVQTISKKTATLEKLLDELETKIRKELIQIPNLLHESVPFGKDESDNKEIKKWGEPPNFSFEPKTHLELTKSLIDFESGSKASGSGFTYLKNELVLLDLALQRFAIDFLMNKGYMLIEPPYMINRKTYESMIGNPEEFTEASYKIDGEDLFLIPTAEYPLGGMFIDKVFTKDELPIKLVGISSAFRKEAGTHGKYAKGLFRMHQFNKVEQFIICLPDDSWSFFDELQKNSEEIYQKLGIHFRVVEICSGDIGAKQAKQYDIEAWMADGNYREIGSNSNCTDYQARRLNLKYREKEGMAPAGFVHTLNNTALATSRTMIAIIEQNQKQDGAIKIPKVLWGYMGGIKEIKP